MRGRGFTLVELVVALGATGVLLTGAALVLTSTATQLDRGVDATASARRAWQAVDEVAGEVQVARSFTTRSTTGVGARVADRTGDGVDEEVLHTFDVPTRTLTTKINGESRVDRRLDAFEIVSFTRAGPLAERLTAQTVGSSSGSGGSDVSITQADWAAIVLSPQLPTGTVSWMPTDLRIALKRGSGNQSLTIGADVVPVTGLHTIGTSPIASGSVTTTLTNQGSTLTIPLTAVTAAVGAGQRVAVRLRVTAGNPTAAMVVREKDISGLTMLFTSSNAGVHWQYVRQGDLPDFTLQATVDRTVEQ